MAVLGSLLAPPSQARAAIGSGSAVMGMARGPPWAGTLPAGIPAPAGKALRKNANSGAVQ
jgi:hypothetical protein